MNDKKLIIKTNTEKPSFGKRVIAYLIDIILVMLLTSVISLLLVDNEAYQEKSKELMDLTSVYTSGEMTREEYTEKFDELNYYLVKEGVGTTIVNVGVALVYYVILCYYCHGITLGKFLMKLQIVGTKEKKLNIGNYLIRGLFVNLLLSNLVSIIFALGVDKANFIKYYSKTSNVFTIFLLASALFIMYRNDGRGLHDLLAGTKVISTKEKKINVEVQEVKEEKEDEVVEAKVIEEKKTTKKSTTKKKTNKKEVKK